MKEKLPESLQKYCNYVGTEYEKPMVHGYSSISMLEFLYGMKLDELTFNYIYSLNPTSVRIVGPNDVLACDCYHGRVTIRIDDECRIEKIDQEVNVGLNGCEHGHDLRCKIKERKNEML